MGNTVTALLILGLALLPLPVLAERLDDSLSPQQQFDIELDWKHKQNGDHLDDRQFNALIAHVHHVEVRLNTAPYTGMRARIYLLLPLNIRGTADSTAMRMSWKTNGDFASGSVTAGNRSKLFEGKITRDVMGDIFDFTFEIDARQVFSTLRLQPVYEIETY
jgi:hypothetical protein